MATSLREDLRDALRTALRERQRSTVEVLRSTLAAIDNAEAVPTQRDGTGAVEASRLGAGASDVPRAVLDEDAVRAIVAAEVSDLESAARVYDGLGRADRGRELRTQAALLSEALRA